MANKNTSEPVSNDPAATMRQAFADILANPPVIPDPAETRTDNKRALGEVRKAMVDDALDVARNRPENLRASFSVPGFEAKVTEFETWDALELTHKAIGALIAGRKKAAGSNVYELGLDVYESNKTAAKHDATVQPDVDRLARHFAPIGAGRKRSKAAKPGTNP